ncbi:sensor domain-containing phosphodiesterase [Enterobacillus tribolii]|uniref:EAL domain-containing protein (Putative c-di-GMP-specific phosphodiesterase class I) n=1 Tax=Enterobacillus tribolii TaxID=1487935 RepID=A0A370QNC4_9GAMM|nr:EAL domain-containing protein [Enterobacillus tribolii]MBW7982111.1 sensor domain-containing phosphodiesterase [Enterobacillus tribolii]RDK89867.1 EAL domain-containing protein (putative c-di-GMP-specific phosphodiesterase class I) [Enterobacillus tribolii]
MNNVSRRCARHLNHWWGLPLLFSAVLLPLGSTISPTLALDDGTAYLLFWPLAVALSLLLIFSWRVFPALVLVNMIRYTYAMGPGIGIAVTLAFSFAIGLCWYGFTKQAGSRWSAGFGNPPAMFARLFWLALILPLLLILIVQIAIILGVSPRTVGEPSTNPFTIRSLLNYQSLAIVCLSGVPLCYYLIRTLIRPRFWRVIIRRIRREMAPGVSMWELSLWVLSTAAIVILLSVQFHGSDNILYSDYTLTLLFPLMLFGSMRLGYQLSSLMWHSSVIVLLYNYPGYVRQEDLLHNLAFIMSMLMVFTLTVILMSVLTTRQRRLYVKSRRAAMVDPMVQLHNVRSLEHTLEEHERSVLCFLRIANLDALCRTYGMQMWVEYKQRLAKVLMAEMHHKDERVYQLPSYDLLIRLNIHDWETTLKRLSRALEQFRLCWNGLPLHLHHGIGYCIVRYPVEHLYAIIGELSTMAEISLGTGKPESSQANFRHLQNNINKKVDMLHDIQRALDDNSLILMAQPIQGFRGDRYYEILLRLPGEDGIAVMPDAFLPVVDEFGLNYDIDLWVLKHTLAFIDENRERLPGLCFSVNLTPSTLVRPTLVHDIAELLQTHQVEPYQLILEITETNVAQSLELAKQTLASLRQLGCRIAIDDFGTGYASYDRLKHIEADILKIDGSFIRPLADSLLDQQIVAAMCQIARLKKLTVVAEYVETEAQRLQLKVLGVDYIQGYLLGMPVQLSEL